MAGGVIVFACNENPCSGCFTLLIFCLDIKYIQLLHVWPRPERTAWAGPDIPTIMSTDDLAAAAADAAGPSLTTVRREPYF